MSFYKSYKSSMDGDDIFRVSASRLGAPTSPMVAKQLEETGKRLNEGVKNVEIGTISADKFEFIPDQHFDEIRRIAKLTDAKISVHGPLIDLAGLPEQGGGRWSEDQRKGAEEQLYSILERSFKLSNGENVPVVFHAGHFHSQEFEKGKMGIARDSKTGKMLLEDDPENPGEKKPKIVQTDIRSITAVNQDTGQVAPLEYEEKFMIDGSKQIYDPFRRLHSLNSTSWDEEKLKINARQKEIEELKERLNIKIKENETIEKTGLISDPKYKYSFVENQRDIGRLSGHIKNEFQKLNSEYEDLYDKFMKFASKEQQNDLINNIKGAQENLKPLEEAEKEIQKRFQKIVEIKDKIKTPEEKMQIQNEIMRLNNEESNLKTEEAKELINVLASTDAPNIWRYTGEFAIEKTADTVSSALSRLYKNLKKDGKQDNIPFIALENFFVNSPMSTADDLRKAIEDSRALLAEKLLNDKSVSSETEAKKISERLIGATWDVGHINNLRKAGWEGEELKKKVLEETKNIADVTRHVHITDNFGFHDSHLPPGMGNVPIREIMEQLEKKWYELEKEGKLPQAPRAIVEAGGFVAEIGQNPQVATLEYFGSPFYKNAEASPYFWSTPGRPSDPRSIAASYSGYRESFVEFPSQHFSMYGSSFTTLPKTVGGQVGNESSRFSGTPNN